MKYRISLFFFFACIALQWYIFITSILTPQPLPSTMGLIDEEFYAMCISFFGLVSLASMLIGKLPKAGVMSLSSLLFLLFCTGALVYFSDYYENAGVLPFSIDFDDKNPITQYSELMPAKIGVVYYLIGYHTVMLVLSVLYRRRQQKVKSTTYSQI